MPSPAANILKRQLVRQTLSALRANARIQRAVQAGSNAGGTILIGLGSAGISLSEETKLAGVVALLLGLPLSVFGFFSTFSFAKITPKMLNTSFGIVRERDIQVYRRERAERKYEGLRTQAERLALLSGISNLLRRMVEEAVQEPRISNAEALSAVGFMLDFTIFDMKKLFGIEAENYSFSVYVFHEPDYLIPIASRRPMRTNEKREPVKTTFGIVGHSFSKKREYVCGDTSVDGVFESRPGRGDETSRYASVAAVPISLVGGEPLGVVVASSDVKDRFSASGYDPVEPLRVLASYLALYLSVIQISESEEASNDD